MTSHEASTSSDLILRSGPKDRVSKDGRERLLSPRPSFETPAFGGLLRTRLSVLKLGTEAQETTP
jgi:hypothetical protein